MSTQRPLAKVQYCSPPPPSVQAETVFVLLALFLYSSPPRLVWHKVVPPVGGAVSEPIYFLMGVGRACV